VLALLASIHLLCGVWCGVGATLQQARGHTAPADEWFSGNTEPLC